MIELLIFAVKLLIVIVLLPIAAYYSSKAAAVGYRSGIKFFNNKKDD